MPDGPGKWSEQGVHVLSSLTALHEALGEIEERVETLNTRVWKIALVVAGGGMAAGAGVEWLVGLF